MNVFINTKNSFASVFHIYIEQFLTMENRKWLKTHKLVPCDLEMEKIEDHLLCAHEFFLLFFLFLLLWRQIVIYNFIVNEK